MKRLAKSHEFSNEVFRIRFETEEEELPLFGAKYYFQLEEVVNCPEFLVHFPTLEK
jgi:mRNA (guanine-N7-)-methyltransferase